MQDSVGFFGCKQQKQTLANQALFQKESLLEEEKEGEGEGCAHRIEEKTELKLKSHTQKGGQNRIWASGKDFQMVSSSAVNHFQCHFHSLKSKIPEKELCGGLAQLLWLQGGWGLVWQPHQSVSNKAAPKKCILNKTRKALTIKEKMGKLDYIKIKAVYQQILLRELKASYIMRGDTCSGFI